MRLSGNVSTEDLLKEYEDYQAARAAPGPTPSAPAGPTGGVGTTPDPNIPVTDPTTGQPTSGLSAILGGGSLSSGGPSIATDPVQRRQALQFIGKGVGGAAGYLASPILGSAAGTMAGGAVANIASDAISAAFGQKDPYLDEQGSNSFRMAREAAGNFIEGAAGGALGKYVLAPIISRVASVFRSGASGAPAPGPGGPGTGGGPSAPAGGDVPPPRYTGKPYTQGGPFETYTNPDFAGNPNASFPSRPPRPISNLPEVANANSMQAEEFIKTFDNMATALNPDKEAAAAASAFTKKGTAAQQRFATANELSSIKGNTVDGSALKSVAQGLLDAGEGAFPPLTRTHIEAIANLDRPISATEANNIRNWTAGVIRKGVQNGEDYSAMEALRIAARSSLDTVDDAASIAMRRAMDHWDTQLQGLQRRFTAGPNVQDATGTGTHYQPPPPREARLPGATTIYQGGPAPERALPAPPRLPPGPYRRGPAAGRPGPGRRGM